MWKNTSDHRFAACWTSPIASNQGCGEEIWLLHGILYKENERKLGIHCDSTPFPDWLNGFEHKGNFGTQIYICFGEDEMLMAWALGKKKKCHHLELTPANISRDIEVFCQQKLSFQDKLLSQPEIRLVLKLKESSIAIATYRFPMSGAELPVPAGE